MARLPGNGEHDWGQVLNEYLLTSHNDDGTLKPDAVTSAAGTQLQKLASVAAGANGLPLFNVEEYGAVGDGVADDYKAVLAAWNAMLASPTGGCVFFPRPVVYRIDAGFPGRLTTNSDGAYALFKLPFVSKNDARLSFGVVGVGSPCSPRGTSKRASATSSVVAIDYTATFAWSQAKGLPAVFGAPDYDASPSHRGTNIHFIADGITLQQPVNPSLCGINMETCATVSIGSLAFDVAAPVDHVPEPTHPSGAALLLPTDNSNGVTGVQALAVTGYYTGAPFAGHVKLGSATVARCKVAVPFRRGASRFEHITTLSVTQSPWVFAGYDPSKGVVAVPAACVVKVDCCDIQDDSAKGAAAWTYAPTVGAHFYDPNNVLDGIVWASRNDVDDKGNTDAMWVAGANHFSIFGLFGFTVAGSERIDASAHTPAN